VGQLQALGVKDAALYGADDTILEGGLHSFFLIMDEPEVYNLPRNPARPSNHVLPASLGVVVTAAIISMIGSLIFRKD
jgi:formate dehydrogenase iron-sulfur subunit